MHKEKARWIPVVKLLEKRVSPGIGKAQIRKDGGRNLVLGRPIGLFGAPGDEHREAAGFQVFGQGVPKIGFVFNQ